MQRLRYPVFALALLALLATGASAYSIYCPGTTPNGNQALIYQRVFNDCPTSVVETSNLYPALIHIRDHENDCFGFTNRHTWVFSDDGAQPDTFENCSHYMYCADLRLSGDGGGEGGLMMCPWWAFNGANPGGTDGQFMCNANTGEIACFGGRMPFYSFTAAYGLHYVKDSTIHLEIEYNAHSLSPGSPATIVYRVVYGGTPYSSGPINYDEGNPAEGHGSWGELSPTYVGGYVQAYCGHGAAADFTADWSNICYQNTTATPTQHTTWGQLKSLYR